MGGFAILVVFEGECHLEKSLRFAQKSHFMAFSFGLIPDGTQTN
jgi:hypothetical protein